MKLLNTLPIIGALTFVVLNITTKGAVPGGAIGGAIGGALGAVVAGAIAGISGKGA